MRLVRGTLETMGEGKDGGASGVRARTLLRMAALASVTATSVAVGCDGGYGVVDPLPPPSTSSSGGTLAKLTVTAKIIAGPDASDAGADADAGASRDADADAADAAASSDAGIAGDRYVQLQVNGGNLTAAHARDGLTSVSLDVRYPVSDVDGRTSDNIVVVRVPKGTNAFIVEGTDTSSGFHRSVVIKAELSPDGSTVSATITSTP